MQKTKSNVNVIQTIDFTSNRTGNSVELVEYVNNFKSLAWKHQGLSISQFSLAEISM